MAKRVYKKKYLKRSGKSKNMYSRLKKLEAAIRKMSPEVKNFYRNDQTTVPDYTGAIYNLAAIPQSVGPQGRIGNRVHAIRYKAKLDFLLVPSPQGSQSIRCIVFRDVSNTQTLASQVLDFNGTVNAVNANYNDEERTRFKIVYDKAFNLSNFAGGKPDFRIHINKKLNFNIDYEDSSTTVNKNNLKMLLISDITPTASSFSVVHELMYTDS